MRIVRAPLSGTKRADGRWQITVTLTRPDGAKIKKTLYRPSQREVQAAARELLGKGRTAQHKRTIKDLLEHCKAEPWKARAQKTQEQYAWAAGHIEEGLGSEQVLGLTPPKVVRWLKTLAANPKLSGRSVQICRNVLRNAYREAIEQGWAKSSPADVRLPVAAKPAQRERLAPNDYRLIVEGEVDPVLRSLWEILGETGMRPSEALALERADIFYSMDMHWIRVGKSKTAAGVREVPLPDRLAERLTDREGRLFPFDIHHTEKRWRKAMAAAKVPHTNLYQLRKMCLSRWIANGLPDDVVKQLAGHTDIRLTQNVYNRVGRDRLAEALWSSTSVKQSVIGLSRGGEHDPF